MARNHHPRNHKPAYPLHAIPNWSTHLPVTAENRANSSLSQVGALTKDRIYMKHIRQVTNTSIQGEVSLMIDIRRRAP